MINDNEYQEQVNKLFSPFQGAEDDEYLIDTISPSKCGCVNSEEPTLSIYRTVLSCPKCRTIFFDPKVGWIKDWETK